MQRLRKSAWTFLRTRLFLDGQRIIMAFLILSHTGNRHTNFRFRVGQGGHCQCEALANEKKK
jgi:hypothetical protein